MKIISVRKVPFTGTVYNFHCLPDENYFSHGALVHNCYKSNTSSKATNMSLATFKHILDIIGPQLTQIAFGITGPRTNPDFIDMMKACRERDIVPNFTLTGADLDDDFVAQYAKLVGAVAVSYHGDLDLCFSTILRMRAAGIEQVNIHAVTADYEDLIELVSAIHEEPRVEAALNALVLLSLKPKGRARHMVNITEPELRNVVDLARKYEIDLGFDSCSAHRAMGIFPRQFHTLIEPCESGLFSSYIDCEGFFHPCSFAEGIWENPCGIDVKATDNFLRNVWMHPDTCKWRERLLANSRECPLEF